MKRFYEKQQVWFAVLWILMYTFIAAPIRGNFGDESVWMLLALAAIAAALTALVKKWGLEEKYGLTQWPKDTKKYLYFIPMWLLTTGNLWGGFGAAYPGVSQLWAVLSMLLVGLSEEMLFRGFFFRALLKENGAAPAVIISAVTFGLGHIVNLLTGHGGIETLIQVCYAVSWGFVFTLVYYKSGSLLPGIVSHALTDAFSKFAADNLTAGYLYVGATILIGTLYSIYLSRLPSAFCAPAQFSARS